MLAVRRQEHVMRSARDRAIRSCGMQEYARIFREKDLSRQSIHKYARVCQGYAKGMQGYARVCKSMQRVCKSMQEHAKSMQEYAKVCKVWRGIHKYTRVHKNNMQECARIFRARVLSMQDYIYRASLRESQRL